MKWTALLAIVVIFTSCQSTPENKTANAERDLVVSVPPAVELPPVLKYDTEVADEEELHQSENSIVANTSTELIQDQNQKIIRRATIHMQVKDYVASSKVLKNYIKKQNAYIASEEENRETDKLNNILQIRVNNVLSRWPEINIY